MYLVRYDDGADQLLDTDSLLVRDTIEFGLDLLSECLYVLYCRHPRSLLLGRSEWCRQGGLWLRFSLEVPFENPSGDCEHYCKANRITYHCSDSADSVRTVDIQLCLNPVLHLQNGQSEYPCADSHLIFDIHDFGIFRSKLLSAFRSD